MVKMDCHFSKSNFEETTIFTESISSWTNSLWQKREKPTIFWQQSVKLLVMILKLTL